MQRSSICGALLAALVLVSEAALAFDNDLEEEKGKVGRSTTSTLELVMPEHEPRPADGGKKERAAPEQHAPIPRPVPPSPPPETSPGPAPARNASPAGEDRIPIRMDARAMLGLNDLLLDPGRAMFDERDPLYGTSPPQRDRLDLANPQPEPAPPHSKIEKSVMPDGWMAEHLDLDLNDGVSYRTNFVWKDQNLRLKIYGPIVKGDPGVGAKLRGLKLGDNPIEVRARATTDLQDVQVRIGF